jgi:hypothetical protein
MQQLSPTDTKIIHMFVFWDVAPSSFVEMYHMTLLPHLRGGCVTPTPKTK